MNVSIRVFPREENKGCIADWIKKFEARKYGVLVDNIHGKDFNWFCNEVVGESFLFMLEPGSKRLENISKESLIGFEENVVDLMICFNDDVLLDADQVAAVIDCVFHLDGDNEEVWAKFESFVEKPVWITGEIPNSENSGDEPNTCKEYQFRQYHCVEGDCLIAEIKKPLVDKAYTTLIRNFSEKGERDLFCNFYACPSWGVAESDNAFMKKLWESKMMEGEFDPNEEVRVKIEKIEAGLEPEPKVWRNSLEKVLEIVTAVGYKGLGKRGANNEVDNVKRRE